MRIAALVTALVLLSIPQCVGATVTTQDVDNCLKGCIDWLAQEQFTPSDVGKSWTFEDPGGTYLGAHYSVHFATESNSQLVDEGVAKVTFTVENCDVGTWPVTFKGDDRIILVDPWTCSFTGTYNLTAIKVWGQIAALVDTQNHVIYIKEPPSGYPNSVYPGVLFGGMPEYYATKFAMPVLVLAVEEGVTDQAYKEAVERALHWEITVNEPRGYAYKPSLSQIVSDLENNGYLPEDLGAVLYYYVIPFLIGKECGLVSDSGWTTYESDVKTLITDAVLASQVEWDNGQKKVVLTVDPTDKIAYWLREKEVNNTWVPYSRTYDTAACVLALVHAIKLGLISPDQQVTIGNTTVTVGDLVKWATNALVQFFIDGYGNPCTLEKEAVDQGYYWKEYYYPIEYAFYALWALRDAEKAGLLGSYAKDNLQVALKRYVAWLEGMELPNEPGCFPYNEYIVNEPDFASTCAALRGLCFAVQLGYKGGDVCGLIARTLEAIVKRYQEAKSKGLKYYFYVPTPENGFFLYMSRFFPDRDVHEVSYATAQAVSALAAVLELPSDVKDQVMTTPTTTAPPTTTTTTTSSTSSHGLPVLVPPLVPIRRRGGEARR